MSTTTGSVLHFPNEQSTCVQKKEPMNLRLQFWGGGEAPGKPLPPRLPLAVPRGLSKLIGLKPKEYLPPRKTGNCPIPLMHQGSPLAPPAAEFRSGSFSCQLSRSCLLLFCPPLSSIPRSDSALPLCCGFDNLAHSPFTQILPVHPLCLV